MYVTYVDYYVVDQSMYYCQISFLVLLCLEMSLFCYVVVKLITTTTITGISSKQLC